MYPNIHYTIIYNSSNIEAAYMSTNRWMDKEAVIHINNGILLRHKKQCIWVSSIEMDETITYYTEWRKSEKEKQILYTNTYIWNLGQWYWLNYLQGISGDPDIENRLMDTVEREEGKGGMYGESNMETYITTCKIDSQWELLYDSENTNWGSMTT